MSSRIASSVFDESFAIPDWRITRNRIEAVFRSTDFASGMAFAGDVAHAADLAGHHPDLDVRYPGVVHVVLTTHAVGGLTSSDGELAATISRIAADAGLTSEAVVAQTVEIAIDAMDIDLVRPFWQAVLGYVEEAPSTARGQVDALLDPLRIGPSVWFQQMDRPRPQRNRIHLDVTVAADVADARIAAAVDAGGTLVSDDEARAFWVLADPEGNEACVCTWQDRD